jgi:hypothetical protein
MPPGSTLAGVSPIPADPHNRREPEVTLKDGRKFRLKAPGLEVPDRPRGSAERGDDEPPRDDPRPPHNPLHAGPG